MDYNSMIEKIMPEIRNESKEPFIIYRDIQGDWHSDFTKNQYGEIFDWVDDIKDPFAVTFTGEDFNKGSFSYVYDKIFTERLRAEYDNAVFANTDFKELGALMNLIEENMSEFTHEETDYLTMLDKPLAALYEMNSVSLVSDNPDYDYDYNKTGDFFSVIGNEIEIRIKNFKKQENSKDIEQSDEPKKRNIEGYEEKLNIEFAGKYVVLAENPIVEYPYLVCNIKYDNPLNFEERYNGIITDNYIEAMREFVKRIDKLVESLETEQRESGLPFQTLTAAKYCIPNSNNDDYEGKLIIIKPDRLAPEYRSAEHQLVFCTGGNGARVESLGTKVYVKELYSEKECYYRRDQIAGLADLSKIPSWAIDKLPEYYKHDEFDTAKNAVESNKPQYEKTGAPKNKPKSCYLIIHGNTDEINIGKFSSISEAKKYAKECDIKNYSIKTIQPKIKKPTLQEKLDDAKKKALEQNNGTKDETGNKKKKQNEKE